MKTSPVGFDVYLMYFIAKKVLDPILTNTFFHKGKTWRTQKCTYVREPRAF